MSKLLLIDGHSILNRAFYGVPDLTNSEGIHTNAMYGFLNIMFKFIDEEKPDYVTVAFDLSAPTFRHKVYDGYKGTRKPMLPELRQQVPLMKELLTAMNITIVEKEGFEVTTYRVDGDYEDGRHPKEVRFTSNLKEDLKRRDFTINAMAYHPERGLVDLFWRSE